jgi:acetyltransferase-like isoleucine patch superfamily enzyme
MSFEINNPFNVDISHVKLIGSGKIFLGKNCEIRYGTVIEANNGVIIIEDLSVIGYQSFIQATGELVIGKRSLLGPQCSYICSCHKKDLHSGLIRGKIDVGDNVWIGSNCTINYDITIGQNAIIGANSFVNKNVPSNQTWAGSPIKYIRG